MTGFKNPRLSPAAALIVAAGLLSAPMASAQGLGLSAGGGGGGGRDTGPGGYAAGEDNGRGQQAQVDDSDEQLDIWVQRCNDAGGGMSTAGDGNYDCIDPDGNTIDDY